MFKRLIHSQNSRNLPKFWQNPPKYSKSATGPQFSARISRSAACCIGPPFTCTRLLGFLCQLNRCTRSKCTWLHCARGNASVLLLYDSKLLQNDLIYGNNDKLQGLCVIISYNSHFCHIMLNWTVLQIFHFQEFLHFSLILLINDFCGHVMSWQGGI